MDRMPRMRKLVALSSTLTPAFAPTLALALVLAACGTQAGRPAAVSPAERQVRSPVAAVAPTYSYEGQPRELLPDEQIQQVLNRLTFGAKPGDAERMRSIGVDKWIDEQLHPDHIDDARTDALMSHYAVYDMRTGDMVRDFMAAQQVQREAKRDSKDSAMTPAQERRAILAQNPQLAAA